MMRSILTFLARLLPAGAPGFIYTKLLSAPPVRSLTNRLLLSILPAYVTIPEGTVYINPTDPVISGALTLGVYEPFETRVFRQLIKPGMVVLDIGANIGYYAVIAARLCGPTGRVVAFEPEPVNFALLQKNIAHNNFMTAIARQSAAADRSGTMVLHLSVANKGNHSLVSPVDSSQFTSSIEVSVERIDEAMAAENIPRVDVIKIDVEGAEPMAFAGMTRMLAQPDVAICMEFYPDALRRSGNEPGVLLGLLHKNGFEIHEMSEKESVIKHIDDLDSFSNNLKKGQYTNLLCLKGSFSKFRID